MGTPVIVEGLRTPIGRRDGSLARSHVSSILGHVQKAILERTGVAPLDIGQLVGGCVTQVGEQAFNVTRMAWLAAGLPYEVGALTIDCQCGSSQHANHLVHNMILAGVVDAGIACGVESMSRVAIGANMRNGPGDPKPDDFPYDMPNRFVAAERVAEKYGLTRVDTDAYGLASHTRAQAAVASGMYDFEITPIAVPVDVQSADGATRLFSRDEGPRRTTMERMAAIPPVLARKRYHACPIGGHQERRPK